MLFGAHVSIQGGLAEAVQRALGIGCETLQIFTKSQRQWAARPLAEGDIRAFRSACEENGLSKTIVHASYLINLAAPDSSILKKSHAALVDEVQRAHALGIPYVVVHSGSHRGEGATKGITRLCESVSLVLEQTSDCAGTMILLENSAGQGSTLCGDLHELGEAIAALSGEKRIGVCLDTCHLFAAGYDFRTERNYDDLQGLLASLGILKKVQVLHFNDSANSLGSRVDKHEAIGSGAIGETAFGHWIADQQWLETPAVVETPGGIENYRREMELFKDMRSTG